MDTDWFSAAVFAYLLGHQFGTCSENLKVMGPKTLKRYRFFVTLLHAGLGRKSLNVLKFFKVEFWSRLQIITIEHI